MTVSIKTLSRFERRRAANRFVLGMCAIVGALVVLPAQVRAQELNGVLPKRASQSTDRLIVKWKVDGRTLTRQQKSDRLSRSRAKINEAQALGAEMDVVQLERHLSAAELADAIAAITADPAVEFASPDLRRYPHALPNDSLVSTQWYLLSSEAAALRADAAWDITTGSTGTIVAVLDTGVRFEHPDLRAANEGGKLLPGYDFISGESSSSFIGANDGDGRDADPSDPGDWVDTADLDQSGFEDCEISNSSWHGTRVAGVISAQSNNGIGVAGAAWNAWILPVRVLGKCGGRDADIIAAMRWAAGLSVPGVPDNPHPANIINLSLGADGACTAAYQAAVTELSALGVLIVASAGNEGGAVNAPANCSGVLGVAGVRQVGTKVGFSNLGPGVSIAAPGGNCVTTGPGQPCQFSIVTSTNLGSKTPGMSSYTDQFNFNVGTSFSAPMVAGTAALMHAVNGRLGSEHFIQRLQGGASPFPENPGTGVPNCRVPTDAGDVQDGECYCTTETCGAGLLNAHGAVTHALRPIAFVEVPDSMSPGQSVVLDASASAAACGRSIAAYEWSVVSSSGSAPQLSSTSEAVVSVQAPAVGQYTLRMTVIDDRGAMDSVDVTVRTTTAGTTAAPLASGAACPLEISVEQKQPPSDQSPQPTPRNPSGGGGHIGWELLALVLLRTGAQRKTAKRESTSQRSAG